MSSPYSDNPVWSALEAVARKRAMLGEAYDLLKIQAVNCVQGRPLGEPKPDDLLLLTLYRRVDRYRSGKHKGRPRYDVRDANPVTITYAEYQAIVGAAS